MKVTVDCKSLNEALSTISGLTGAKNAVLSVEDNVVKVAATGKDTVISIVVTGTIDNSKTPFGFSISVMQGITKGRKSITLVHDKKENRVLFSEGKKYSGEFIIVPGDEAVEILKEFKNPIRIDTKILSIIQSAVPSVQISNIHNPTDSMQLHIRIKKKGIVLACFDDFHSAYYSNTEVKSKTPLDFSIPISSFNTLTQLSRGEAYEVDFTEAKLNAKNDWFSVSMPLIQTQQGQALSMLENLLETIPKKPDCSFTTKASELSNLMHNTFSIYEEGAGLKVNNIKDEVYFTSETSFGNIKEKLALKDVVWSKKAKGAQVLDPYMMDDVIHVIPDDHITVSFLVGKFCYIKSESDGGITRLYVCPLL